MRRRRRRRRRSWQSQGEYLISMLVSLFYRMVGGWVYTMKLSELIS
jgi:hypothetical protein